MCSRCRLQRQSIVPNLVCVMLLLTVELTGLRLFECHMSSGPQLDVRHSHTRPCSKLTQETLESDMAKHATKLLCFLQV